MKKISIVAGALSLNLACSGLTAQNIAAQPASQLNIPDYNHLPPGVNLLKNGVRNPDGSVTIKAGQQTPEANDINRRYCESLGGKDATNKTDQTIGTGTIYAVVCEAPPASPQTQLLPDLNRNPFGKK